MPCMINHASLPYVSSQFHSCYRMNNQEQLAHFATNSSYQKTWHSFIQQVFLSSHYVPMPSLCLLTGMNLMYIGPTVKGRTDQKWRFSWRPPRSVPSGLPCWLHPLPCCTSSFHRWIWNIVCIYYKNNKSPMLWNYRFIIPNHLQHFLFKNSKQEIPKSRIIGKTLI